MPEMQMPEGTEPPADVPVGPAATEPAPDTSWVKTVEAKDYGKDAVTLRDPVAVADDFALEVQDRDGDRKLAAIEERERTSRALACVWSMAVAVIFLGLFALIASAVHDITTEHDHEHSRLVTVWCYADPNSDRGTSTITGTTDQVASFCPDQRQP